MKVQKIPVIVDAVQLTWGTWSDVCELLGQETFDEGARGCYIDDEGQQTADSNGRIGLILPTLEGDMLAIENDWIIKGILGEFYPCKPEVFEKTYVILDQEQSWDGPAGEVGTCGCPCGEPGDEGVDGADYIDAEFEVL